MFIGLIYKFLVEAGKTPESIAHAVILVAHHYRIVGIFHGGKYLFFSNTLIFVHFIFVVASSAPFNNTGSHTPFVKFCSFLMKWNEKNENFPH